MTVWYAMCLHTAFKFSQFPVLGLLRICSFGVFLILWYKELINLQV